MKTSLWAFSYFFGMVKGLKINGKIDKLILFWKWRVV